MQSSLLPRPHLLYITTFESQNGSKIETGYKAEECVVTLYCTENWPNASHRSGLGCI